jgi:hypothetical protein
MKKISIILIFFISLSLRLSSQKIVTDRPDQTESSMTVPKKSFQIETGLLTGLTDYNNISERQFLIPTTLIRYGLARIIEIRIVEQLVSLKTNQTSDNNFGLSDLELGTKIQILRKENVNTEIAFLSHLILPSGTNGLSNNRLGTVNKIAISHSLNDFLDIGYNLGYSYFGKGKGDLIYSVTMGAGISKNFGIYFETYGEVNEFKNPVSNLDSGLTYLIKDNLQFDLSFGIGLNQKMNYFSIGCSWNICKRQNS